MITDDKIVIRPIQENDLEIMYKWNNEESRGKYQELHLKSLVEIKKEYEEEKYNSDKFKLFIIDIQGIGQIGTICVNFIREGLVGIGFEICESKHRNFGHGTKAVKLLVKYLFDNYYIARIQADTDIENIPTQRVLEKVGFKKDGILRNYRYHHGEWRDFIIYSILREELK